jgi:DNA-binding Lrp family transcriptional regulator
MSTEEATIYRFMLTHQATYGWPPSTDEIAQMIRYTPAGVRYRLERLVSKGFVTRDNQRTPWRALAYGSRSLWTITLLRYQHGRLLGGAVFTDDRAAFAAMQQAIQAGERVQLFECYQGVAA